MSPERTRSILLIDDSYSDLLLIREALSSLPHPPLVSTFHRSLDALTYLEGRTAQEPWRPDLIFLDLSMPGLDGFEVLARLKASPKLATIPVVILSGSEAPGDIRRAYDGGAAAYLIKPMELDMLTDMLHATYRHWTELSRLP